MAPTRATAALLACVALLAASSVAAENVVTITGEASFNEAVASSDFVVMEFYGACKRPPAEPRPLRRASCCLHSAANAPSMTYASFPSITAGTPPRLPASS